MIDISIFGLSKRSIRKQYDFKETNPEPSYCVYLGSIEIRTPFFGYNEIESTTNEFIELDGTWTRKIKLFK